MDLYDESFPVSLIRQHCFCPRIPFLVVVYGIQPAMQTWMRSGIDFHNKTAMLEKRRNLKRFGLNEDARFEANVPLGSKSLGLHGICDGALFTESDKVFPLEFKQSTSFKMSRGHKQQLVAYSLLLSEQFDLESPAGFLLYGSRGETYRVDVTETEVGEVKRTISEIRNNFQSQLLPASGATDRQCCQCEFLNFCADRF